jgi:Protein of unknown function DUF262/Protein of unknown function (DUF1524)
MSPTSETKKGSIEYAHHGIGEALKRSTYAVPVNQRNYAWEEPEITALLSDFTNAINVGRPAYFLGTIVLTRSGEKSPSIADGQQRLATITILLAAIRDWFFLEGEEEDSTSIETDFLRKFDRDVRGYTPTLTLNSVDNEFFLKRILSRPDSPDRNIKPTKWSHERIERAAEMAAKHVATRVKGLSKEHAIAHLNQWVRFLQDTAQVIVLTVPDDLDAFTMFETLNDRGLKTSQADLIKNYLFSQAKDREKEAQQKWDSMVGALETLEDEDITLTYIRTLLTSLYGLTRADKVFKTVKDNVAGRNQAVTFLDMTAEYANEYVAILSPDAPKWNEYARAVPRSIAVIKELGVAQIRPLMLSVARHFSIEEANKAFPLFVNWSVRFLISGGGRGGSLEEAYAAKAQEVTQGDILTTKMLAKKMADRIPSDALFAAAFAGARVSKSHLARYYLRALEMKFIGDTEPAWIPNEDVVINVEHILPINPGDGWEHIHPETASTVYKRLGNMVLMQASKNSEIGNKAFHLKRPLFQSSPYLLTQMVGKKIHWDVTDIDERQVKLAEIAVKTWPIK